MTEKVHPGRPRGMARAVRKAYAIQRDCLVVPRVKGPCFLRTRNSAGLPLLDDVRAPEPPGALRRIDPVRCEPAEPLYDYQEVVASYLCDGPLASPQGVAYLQMDTGLGKTRVGCAVVARRGEPALVVVPTQAIAYQWEDEFREIYPEMSVGVYHNLTKSSRKVPPGPESHDAVIVVVNTFRDKDPSFMRGYGITILDEAHEYYSAHNCRALWLSQTRAVLGLSATPLERPDGLDRYVTHHLGAVILSREIPGFDICTVKFRGEARIVEYVGRPDHCATVTTPSGTMSAILTIENVLGDDARLRLVAAEVERLYKMHKTMSSDELLRLGLGPRPESAATPTHPVGEIRRHGIFVFAELRDYLPRLREAIFRRLSGEVDDPDREILVPEIEVQVSVLRGGVTSAEVERARSAGAHIVLTTYGFSRRGISLPDMTAIVEATPRRNGMRQILGRIGRRGSDESIVRQVVDIVDARTGLKGQVSDRRKIYNEKEYPITKCRATWEDYPGPKEGGPAGVVDNDGTDFDEMTTGDLLDLALG